MFKSCLHKCVLIWLLVMHWLCRKYRIIAVIHTQHPICNWITDWATILHSSNLNMFIVVSYLLKCCTSGRSKFSFAYFFFLYHKYHKMNHVAALRQQMGVTEMTKYALQMWLLDYRCSSAWNSTDKQASSYAKSFTGVKKMCLVKRRWKRWKYN